ncbi:MAG: sulfotransferase [Alphaproteobacteria bacterium]
MAGGKRLADNDVPVPLWVRAIGGHVSRHPGFWRRLANLETRVLADELAEVAIDRPVYVCGLARSGTTILLETLSRHSRTASHCYGDYPFTFTPFWWNWLLARMPQEKTAPQERIHKDGILVTAESPEALEESLWMAFFPHLHDPHADNRLTEDTENPVFERFYRAHIRKLLLARGRSRYLAKGNYNLTRIPWLLKLFPDARFVVPVRDPVWHIASLMKQHRLFCDAERKTPALLDHMRRVGHFEFGLDWRPVNPGDTAGMQRVLDLWNSGQEVRGWAAYWALIHRYVAAVAEVIPAVHLVRYEDLCTRPNECVAAMLKHCGLEAETAVMDFAGTLHAPGYYRPEFSATDLAVIAEETEEIAGRLGVAVEAVAAVD